MLADEWHCVDKWQKNPLTLGEGFSSYCDTDKIENVIKIPIKNETIFEAYISIEC